MQRPGISLRKRAEIIPVQNKSQSLSFACKPQVEMSPKCAKYFFREDFSRKGAKRCRVSKGFSLRLCAFAGEIFSEEILSGKAA
jgi:hypothetical protein